MPYAQAYEQEDLPVHDHPEYVQYHRGAGVSVAPHYAHAVLPYHKEWIERGEHAQHGRAYRVDVRILREERYDLRREDEEYRAERRACDDGHPYAEL